ncbi:MAG: hypothetical protein QGI77_04290, partial [Roseibacillus sp.]|nr:hypothetical protein [Roseibacillus sp.]
RGRGEDRTTGSGSKGGMDSEGEKAKEIMREAVRERSERRGDRDVQERERFKDTNEDSSREVRGARMQGEGR